MHAQLKATVLQVRRNLCCSRREERI